jgi:hypothetical protein
MTPATSILLGRPEVLTPLALDPLSPICSGRGSRVVSEATERYCPACGLVVEIAPVVSIAYGYGEGR